MSMVRHDFEVRLYREHLEEVSFLYEQRLLLRSDPTLPWPTLADHEERIEAHLDALVVGDALALQVCRARVAEADFGELHAIASVYCRQHQASLLGELLRRLDDQDASQIEAVADALKYELPDEWANFIEQALVRADHRQTGLLARVVAYRRLPLAEPLLKLMAAPEHDKKSVAHALGRLQAREAEPALLACARGGMPALQTEALRALLMVAPHAAPQPWPVALLPLAGNASALRGLATETAKKPSAEALLALGLAGELSCLRVLYDQLHNAELAEPAALALHWITGARLEAPVFVPDAVEEDELIGEELEAWRARREPPKRADGKPIGSTVTKVSTDARHWKLWFQQHAAHFRPELRYRGGQPVTPAVLVATLRAPHTHPTLRRHAADELAIRYGCPEPFEIDMPVARQYRALQRMEAWSAQQGHLQPGGWYLAGQPQQAG